MSEYRVMVPREMLDKVLAVQTYFDAPPRIGEEDWFWLYFNDDSVTDWDYADTEDNDCEIKTLRDYFDIMSGNADELLTLSKKRVLKASKACSDFQFIASILWPDIF